MKGRARGSSRSGLTLLELVVAAAVIAVLLALIAPALLQGRSASRRVACSNNLRQIATAISNHASQTGCLIGRPDGGGYESAWGLYGTAIQRMEWPGWVDVSERGSISPVFRCPGDARRVAAGGGEDTQINYFANDGLPHVRPHVDAFGMSNHVLGVMSVNAASPSRRLRSVTDGLSQTALASERLSVVWPPWTHELTPERVAAFEASCRSDGRRTFWHVPSAASLSTREFESACLKVDPSDGTCYPLSRHGFGVAGSPARYNHALPPNSPSCLSSGAASGLVLPHREDIVTATSGHAGGVNAAFCDGRVVFVADGIGRAVWQAAGTSSAGDSFDGF